MKTDFAMLCRRRGGDGGEGQEASRPVGASVRLFLSADRLCRSEPAWTAGKGVTSALGGYRSGLSEVGGAGGRSWIRLLIRPLPGRNCASVSYPFRCAPQAAKPLAVE